MGNCLLLPEESIKVMKTDGKVLEYKPPLKVHQVLSEFAGHSISDTLPVVRHLAPQIDMLSGRLYYLLPPPLPSTQFVRKVPMVSSNSPTAEPRQRTGVVRIKLVITKQELREMLAKGGISVNEIVAHLQSRQSKAGVVDDNSESCKGWRPVLESIPEGEGSDLN
ncbi:PREDICTED: uncharacterized protein LOC104607668 [Nelumbo nucifera]|uniref:Uncharacterized protein LOC104607668 n=2 Tax=Nelumbo nucifera TaxID=4432 RepID=A0A1U8AUP4_NELNU|nr:PREDICTED: uncharacterized protein LOC104607668 [Nelumbo nucifera]DAD28838.1 TPA_asm: hypothetical protein HUJ06_030306 [Nelumbo nucifera]